MLQHWIGPVEHPEPEPPSVLMTGVFGREVATARTVKERREATVATRIVVYRWLEMCW